MRVGGPGILRITTSADWMASDVANGRGEPSATALVGMEGLIVKSQTVRDGEHWLLVQTMEPSRWCPSCGVAGVGNGRRRVVVRDLPIARVPTVLVWD